MSLFTIQFLSKLKYIYIYVYVYVITHRKSDFSKDTIKSFYNLKIQPHCKSCDQTTSCSSANNNIWLKVARKHVDYRGVSQITNIGETLGLYMRNRTQEIQDTIQDYKNVLNHVKPGLPALLPMNSDPEKYLCICVFAATTGSLEKRNKDIHVFYLRIPCALSKCFPQPNVPAAISFP